MVKTSESLKAHDSGMENYHYQLEDGTEYRLTPGELEWLEFVRGRYSIHDHLVRNMAGDVYTVDVAGMSEALQDDGSDFKAVCLSDDTALQSIFFYSALPLDVY